MPRGVFTTGHFYADFSCFLSVFSYNGSRKCKNRNNWRIYSCLTIKWQIPALWGLLALGDFTGNHGITTIAGYVGIFCGLSAFYSAMGQILNAEYGKTILPLG